MPDKTDIQTELDLFSALEDGEAMTQMALSERLSVSVGLVNSLLKRIVRKGWAKVQAAPPRRWAYYITPKGFAEKSRLVASYLEQSLAFFREARSEFASLFAAAYDRGHRRAVLAGAGELAEIALLAAKESRIDVIGIIDPQANTQISLGVPVWQQLDDAEEADFFIITDMRAPDDMYQQISTLKAGKPVVAPSFLHVLKRPAAAHHGQPEKAEP